MRSLLAIVIFYSFSFVSTPIAQAHAALESTVPAKDSIVSKFTSQVSMFFGEEILVIKGKNPNSITALDSHGVIVSTGRVDIAGRKISIALKAPLKIGRYKVKYRVVSADGHVVTGSYPFTVK